MQTLIVLIIVMAFLGFYINNSKTEKMIEKRDEKLNDSIVTEMVKEKLKETPLDEENKTDDIKPKNPVIGTKNFKNGFKKNNVIVDKGTVNGGFLYDTTRSKNLTEEWGHQGIEVENEIEPQESSYIKRNRIMNFYNNSVSFGKDGIGDNIVNSHPDIHDAKLKNNLKLMNISVNAIRNSQENSYKNNIDIMNTDPNNLLQYSKSKTLPSNFSEGRIKYTPKIDISDGKNVPLNNDIFNTRFSHDLTIDEDRKQINRLFLKK